MFSKYLLFINQLAKKTIAIPILLLLLSLIPSHSLADENEAYEHLYEVMDKFHNSFNVYSNQDEGGNHFYPSGWMGDISSVSFDSNWIANCYSGTSCIKITFTASGNNWAGIYWQEPENNWGTVPNGGYDISGATKLTFWAKGENGGERVEFFVGDITGPYPDSLPKTSTGYITLTSSWQEYTIDLTSKDLSHVIGGFGWVTNSSNNQNGAIFYLDEIKYDKSRPDELKFLVSFETLPVVNPDRYIKNASFIYDNALALLSFLARGNNDDLKRAKILADAFVYAQNNDRYYTDGRLRNAYMSGHLIDHLTGKARLPGWWDPDDEKWYEDEFQVSTHTGNLAWVMIALLSYYKKVGGNQYLETARILGEWIEMETGDTRCAGGYTGGYEGWEPNSQKITWKSTEHNIDLYVAFMLLYEITGDTRWEERALHAKNFVEAMWNDVDKHFWIGTLDDGCTININNSIPIDIQAWALMALGSYNSALSWAEDNCYTEHNGFKGFDFNNDNDGVWFEGTAQMAVAYQLNEEGDKSDFYIAELLKAQSSALNNNGKGIVAACHDGVTTGLNWKYFSRLHIGATAWYIFAEMEYNPYWGTNECEEDTPGQLDIVGNYGAPDGTTEIAVVINNAPNDVASMGFEVTYDTTILEYSGYSRGDLTKSFDQFDCNENNPGLIKCGGYEAGDDIISIDSSGTVVTLQFNVTECTQDQNYPVFALQGLVDDIADPDWTTSGGCFTCGCCHDGEVNGDGKLTPQDALCAFQHYLGITDGPCGPLDECQQDHADVEEPQDPGSNITPADALCIFQKYLGLPSCLDGVDICESP